MSSIENILQIRHRKRKIRNNYDDSSFEFLSYQKSRKKTTRQEKKLRKKLLKYLLRLTRLMGELCKKHSVTLPPALDNSFCDMNRLLNQFRIARQEERNQYDKSKQKKL